MNTIIAAEYTNLLDDFDYALTLNDNNEILRAWRVCETFVMALALAGVITQAQYAGEKHRLFNLRYFHGKTTTSSDVYDTRICDIY